MKLSAKHPADFIVTRVRELPAIAARQDSPAAVYSLWHSTVATAPGFEPEKERLAVFLLNTKYNLIGTHTVSIGSLNESIAHPREVFRPVIVAAAYAFILAHNHPSGDPSPSQADHSLTRRLRECAALLQIPLLDHVVVGDRQFFSFKEAGLI